MDRIPYRQIRSLLFEVYDTEHIRKLSVQQITNPETFDSLEHPTAGGLYDPHLGSLRQDEPCSTCGLTSIYCPGHMGHVELPLPVFHPLFLEKTLLPLLRGSCLKCHRLLVPSNAKYLALYQLKALDYGSVRTVQDLEEVISDSTLLTGKDDKNEIEFRIRERLKSVFEEAARELAADEYRNASRVKNVVECRQRIMKNFIKEHLMKQKRKCLYCDEEKAKVTLRQKCEFVFVGTREPIKARASFSVKIENGRSDKDSVNPGNTSLTPSEAKKHLSLLWEQDGPLLSRLFSILDMHDTSTKNPTDVFFIDALLIPPSRFRPLAEVKGKKYLNPQSVAIQKVLLDSVVICDLLKKIRGIAIDEPNEDNLKSIPGKTNEEKLHFAWRQLQIHINGIYDSDLDKSNKDKATTMGIKQILEKKEGLFRKHMMGKRVNFAARSVISPDPCIMVDEIGVPAYFAMNLTYPEPVTDWNVAKLRAIVNNGPNVHPGAVKIENEDGSIVRLKADDPVQRHAVACRLLTPSTHCKGPFKLKPKIVYRHLQSGDIVLLNRQPTLHKPSIMAHKARVLPCEKTLRLHYANCKSYNADFDGDEMNVHFPQSEIARAEGLYLAAVNHQYLVPKDGTPLSGLIQDHIIASTLLTMRGMFFKREDYNQLVYGALPFIHKPIKMIPPSIWKPQVLWSGKQIVSTIIINVIPAGKPPITLEGKAKVPVKNWQNMPSRPWNAGGTLLIDDDMSESQVIINSGELLCGVIDKAHIGPTPYGLIHCCYELYGGETSTALLSSLARLFTNFLQIYEGFTLGIEDILLTDKADKKRHKLMRKIKKVGDKVVAAAFDVDDPKNANEIIDKFKEAHLSKDDTGLKTLDFEMKKTTDKYNNDVNNACMPNGLIKKFPQNNLQLMVQSGAKGATVNAMQISCLLGQIELEGRRVPLMMNGRTLPSFLPYDTSPAAGGFVAGRFLTGLRPQEYFFHCMAGREGLVDTAVKTSKSGYLQRCLIKHMEGVTVNYDLTVRDSDGSVIQFLYGEDGLDISRLQMLKQNQLHILAKNYNAVINEVNLFNERQLLEVTGDHRKAIRKWKRKNENSDNTRCSAFLKFQRKCSSLLEEVKLNDRKAFLTNKWRCLDVARKDKYIYSTRRCPDPVNSVHRPDLAFGAISEKFDSIIEDYICSNPYSFLCDDKDDDSNDGVNGPRKFLSVNKFRSMSYYHALRALAQPGEAVGLLAAQSVGEPSTQMTLNTFHFAGRGEMNVTLGIPRLREILMNANANIKTPTMDLPLFNKPGIEDEAKDLKIKLSSVYLKQVIESVEVSEKLHIKARTNRFRMYTVKMNFLPYDVYENVLYTSPSSILNYIEHHFIKRVITVIKKKLKSMSSAKLVESVTRRAETPTVSNADDENEGNFSTNINFDESEDDDDVDFDSADARNKMHGDEGDYESAEDEEIVFPESEAEDDVDDPTYRNESAMNTENEIETDDDEKKFDPLSISHKLMQDQKIMRVSSVKSINTWVSHYDYDTKTEQWCEFTLQLCLGDSKLDMQTLIEDEINKAIVYGVPNIKSAFLVKNPHPGTGYSKMLKTDGVNFLEIFQYVDIIDVKKVYSNDIHAIASIYGIEAAARVIVKEVTNVFATYGIEVDPRHLLLIADYMTYEGKYKACNRIGMESHASPLQQMTFETTTNFLKSAALTGSVDQLKSPSSRLVLGMPVSCGTGCFDILVKPETLISKKKNKYVCK